MKKTISLLLVLAVLLSAVYASAQDSELSASEMENAAAAEVLDGGEAEEMVEEMDDEMAEELGEEEIFDLHGEVIEITEEYIVLSTAELGDVQVNLSEDTIIEGVQALEIGQTALVMYNGQMTRSLPPQITALHIGVYAVSGVITQVNEDSIVIEQDETGEEVVIMLPQAEMTGENEELLEDEALAESEETEATEETAETDEAEEIVVDAEEMTAETDEETDEDADQEDMQLQVGDRVIVYTNGAMTMSLPPMMNALSIVPDLGEEIPADEALSVG